MNIARQIPNDILLTDMTIRTLIDTQAKRYGDGIFLLDPETHETITYDEVRRAAKSVTNTLKSAGIKKGESVAYALSNGPNCALTILGILYGGFHATAINLIAGAKTIGYVFEHSQARLIITDPEHHELLDIALVYSSNQPPRLDSQDLLVDNDKPTPTSASDLLTPNDDGLLMYTSGTTGTPKGVVLSHQNLVAGALNAAIAHELGPADRALCVLPLYHINGLCVTLLAPLVSGGSVVLTRKFSSSQFWNQLRDNQCTWFSVVPTQISYLLHDAKNRDAKEVGLEKVRFGRSASAPLSPDVQSTFESLFDVPIIETMGLTETAAQILSNPLPPATRKVGSPGMAVGNEIIIADKSQREVSRGEEGEVLVRGKNVMGHYLNNPEVTKETFGENGWFKTGDLGRMDDEGYVFITGRLKELIIKGGENIAPREIDEALYAHPDIIEAAAFAKPSKDYGQTIEAAVAVREKSNITPTELLAFCSHRLGKFKTPDKIHFLDELPKGPSGKIQRIKIFELIEKSHQNK
jgi:sulfoacetate-CoA ligase